MASKFYQDRIPDHNFNKIQSLQDFSKLVPTTTREEIRLNYDDFIGNNWNKNGVTLSTTSGTTGTALQFYQDRKDNAREWAAICHQWKRVGYVPGVSKRAEFRGLTESDSLVNIYPHLNMLRCSILSLKKEHVLFYAEKIRDNRIDFFHGYPSAIYLLSKEILKHKIDFPQPNAVLLASEMVYDWQLEKIRESFPKSKIFSHYGCAERVVLAGWCENSQEYHVLPQYSLVEFDKITTEVIGTNLFNNINGFVRYKLSDTVLSPQYTPCSNCNRSYYPRFNEISGRIEDYLYSPENGWIPPAIVTYPLKDLKIIREIQFRQIKLDEISILYTKFSESNESVENELNYLRSKLPEIFGKSTVYKFKEVTNFKKNSVGKFKWIINETEAKQGNHIT
jgi:phenylacetate-CoA ligase